MRHHPSTSESGRAGGQNPQFSVTYQDGMVITTKYAIGAGGARYVVRYFYTGISPSQHVGPRYGWDRFPLSYDC